MSYATQWIWFAFFTLFLAIICNGIFGVPLSEVANISISLAIFYAAFVAALSLVLLTTNAAAGRFVDAAQHAFAALLQTLQPLSAVLAFSVYGWFGGQSLSGQSFMFDGLLSGYASGSAAAMKWLNIPAASDVSDIMKLISVLAAAVVAIDIVYRVFFRGDESVTPSHQEIAAPPHGGTAAVDRALAWQWLQAIVWTGGALMLVIQFGQFFGVLPAHL